MGPRSRKRRANQQPMPNVNQMQGCVSKTSRYCFCIYFCFLRAYLEAVFTRVSEVIHISPYNFALFVRKSRPTLSSHQMRDKWFLVRTCFPALFTVFMYWLPVLIGYLVVCVPCDWLERLCWLWFYETQFKTVVVGYNVFEQLNTSCQKTLITMFLLYLNSSTNLCQTAVKASS